jgi:polyisoprenoid-binding protein YceI
MAAGVVTMAAATQVLSGSAASAGQAAAPAAAAPAAATGAFEVDAVHSSVVFKARHNQVSWFYGSFAQVGGSIDLREGGSLEVKIQAKSVNSNNANRDKHLVGDDFFSAEEHPEITFKSSSIKSAGDKKFEAAGTLTFRGVEKPLTVTIDQTGAGKGRGGTDVMGLWTTFTIKRSDFGNTYGVPGISDEVELIVSLQGKKGG